MSAIAPETLWQWAQEYASQAGKRCLYQQSLLRRLERFFAVYPGQSFIDTLNRTEPLIQWVRRPQFRTLGLAGRQLEIRALRGFTAWLLVQGKTEHDVYFYVPTGRAVAGEVPSIHLHSSLQREILNFKADIWYRGEQCKSTYFWLQAAHLFNLYRNRPGASASTCNELLVAWLREISDTNTRQRTSQLLGGLARFSKFVANSSRVPDVNQCLSRYRSRMAVIGNIADLSSAEKQSRFQSGLTSWFEDYLKFQDARKMRLDCIEVDLRRLDRVALRHSINSPQKLAKSMFIEYLEENEPGPAAFNQRLARLRGFRFFLLRKGIILDWPTGLSRRQVPPFRPHLYSLAEIRQILDWFESSASKKRHDTLYWTGLKAVVFLLYAGALRLREPVRLRLKDVDLENSLLFIHNTKFYKQRWVPVGQRATQHLADYFELRCQRFPGCCTPDAPFFLNSYGRSLITASVGSAFRKAREELQMQGRGTRSWPRLHDLRHTAAVHKLYQWYSEGKDVQNKLPLLSAYLGHDRLQHTEKYLHLTKDLLRLAGGNFRISFDKVVGVQKL